MKNDMPKNDPLSLQNQINKCKNTNANIQILRVIDTTNIQLINSDNAKNHDSHSYLTRNLLINFFFLIYKS